MFTKIQKIKKNFKKIKKIVIKKKLNLKKKHKRKESKLGEIVL